MKSIMLPCAFLVLITTANLVQAQSTVEILNSFAEDFQEDPASKTDSLTFGVRVKDEGAWHISVNGSGGVEVVRGVPPDPTFVYVTDGETLLKIHRGELSVFTAMGKARSSDPAPMDVEFMDGFALDPNFLGTLIPFTFHFWTRGFPEIIAFGDESYTREVHGANVAVLYYQRGFRSAWYQIRKGQHINRQSEDQTNPFPTLVIFTNGEAEARIGGKHVKLRSGQSALIPRGVTHEFWNDNDDPAEFIILMFGEGA